MCHTCREEAHRRRSFAGKGADGTTRTWRRWCLRGSPPTSPRAAAHPGSHAGSWRQSPLAGPLHAHACTNTAVPRPNCCIPAQTRKQIRSARTRKGLGLLPAGLVLRQGAWVQSWLAAGCGTKRLLRRMPVQSSRQVRPPLQAVAVAACLQANRRLLAKAARTLVSTSSTCSMGLRHKRAHTCTHKRTHTSTHAHSFIHNLHTHTCILAVAVVLQQPCETAGRWDFCTALHI